MICESLYIIILFGFIESYTTFRQLSGIYQNSFDDKYQDVNAVSIQTVASLLDCVARCGKEQRCLRIFHNRITQICILHSDPFTYTATKTGEGWRSYLTNDANIASVHPTGICIQGTNTIDVSNAWTFYDGTPMTFFKWIPSEPIGLGWIRINRGSDFEWEVPPRPNWWTCTYMCEIRII
ncbi:unnamed protein product [Mytilus edulis]|uniref:Apple domain-containing protein n=1 Tax=Mytilus edulis TaxID=6550 RepID=A0A8S3UYL7_MYTED|nr:unnamed protein product [Mytilus edulis]